MRIYDFGRTREGQPYYVMEYLDGVTLAELVAHSGAVPPGRVIHILRQVGAALREAHEHGMVHRDVKPENVMLCRRGEDDVVKLLDFGLVKKLERAKTRDITKQLKILGTPRYMSPERILNPADVDARSDVYALGAVGYFLLAGKADLRRRRRAGDREPGAAHDWRRAFPRGVRRDSGGARRADRRMPREGAGSGGRRRWSGDRGARPPGERLAWTQADAEAWWKAYRESRGADASTEERAAPVLF